MGTARISIGMSDQNNNKTTVGISGVKYITNPNSSSDSQLFFSTINFTGRQISSLTTNTYNDTDYVRTDSVNEEVSENQSPNLTLDKTQVNYNSIFEGATITYSRNGDGEIVTSWSADAENISVAITSSQIVISSGNMVSGSVLSITCLPAAGYNGQTKTVTFINNDPNINYPA